mmetsp:Transcript_31264/g.105180  ORF Transcript_31264/g.105180 Transcript_31264/m.105180 type:complete len:329 (-) Transcript_31264:478-1464(-)
MNRRAPPRPRRTSHFCGASFLVIVAVVIVVVAAAGVERGLLGLSGLRLGLCLWRHLLLNVRRGRRPRRLGGGRVARIRRGRDIDDVDDVREVRAGEPQRRGDATELNQRLCSDVARGENDDRRARGLCGGEDCEEASFGGDVRRFQTVVEDEEQVQRVSLHRRRLDGRHGAVEHARRVAALAGNERLERIDELGRGRLGELSLEGGRLEEGAHGVARRALRAWDVDEAAVGRGEASKVLGAGGPALVRRRPGAKRGAGRARPGDDEVLGHGPVDFGCERVKEMVVEPFHRAGDAVVAVGRAAVLRHGHVDGGDLPHERRREDEEAARP